MIPAAHSLRPNTGWGQKNGAEMGRGMGNFCFPESG